MDTAAEKRMKAPDPYAEPLPGAGRMAIIVPLIIGCAVVLSALVLWDTQVKKKRIAEMARTEEQIRGVIRAGYRELRNSRPDEAMLRVRQAEDMMRRIRTVRNTDYAELLAGLLLMQGEAEFMLDGKANAAAAEDKFSRALGLMPHASGNMWQFGLLGRARTRLAQGKYAGAEADLTLLVDRNPSYGTAYYWRSRARTGQDNPQGAGEDRARAESLDAWPPPRDFIRDSSGRTRDILARPRGRD